MDDDEWAELTPDEKADWLRDEFKRMIAFVNDLSGKISRVASRVQALEAAKQQTAPPKAAPQD